ncbi:MAG: hypothetical protein V4709_13160 [Pseudomonadota bacterium]
MSSFSSGIGHAETARAIVSTSELRLHQPTMKPQTLISALSLSALFWIGVAYIAIPKTSVAQVGEPCEQSISINGVCQNAAK